ncbi:polyhydroxybutyrate depolymerase [Mycobacterium sp. ST-F2]|uniref:extracellular catalytic domain type 1 short-chain-length polyhydroxyalkanoate depolymerase n=1 Tax=Mycobacterium sp. ST-F2 TaxID=1490484 RepID=UPI000938D2F5|nr:PHB depolymerase family esterase [Mycobacterium sp. ST-F2]OKH83633.1 polyhydroxybutyrate depolymerase [Mycobacterium sp. ST-F2]
MIRSLQRVSTAVLLTAALLVSGGCLGRQSAAGAPEGAIPVGQSSHSVQAGGVTRTFHLYRPDGLSGPAPLVVMLHGGYGDGAQAERAYNWDTQADGGHFLVAYPDGMDRAWNAGTCCGVPKNRDVDDVGFITAMVGAIEAQTSVDPSRVYVTGMSNGAMMALRLACQTDLFGAIAPVAGTLLTDCARAAPTSILQIHGTADDRVPYDGGPGKARTFTGAPNVDGPSVPTVNATWRGIDACAAPVTSISGAVTTQTAQCPGGRTVELISVADAGHQWPGGVPSPLAQRLGDLPPPSTALNATHTIWEFFAGHHR